METNELTPQIDFNAPKLAELVEKLTLDQIDSLPFGVVRLDDQGAVSIYNKTEGRLSGFGDRPVLGRRFFVDIAPCTNNAYFKGLIDKARRAGTLNIAFTFVGDFCDRDRELSVRAQSANEGGTWIFTNRP